MSRSTVEVNNSLFLSPLWTIVRSVSPLQHPANLSDFEWGHNRSSFCLFESQSQRDLPLLLRLAVIWTLFHTWTQLLSTKHQVQLKGLDASECLFSFVSHCIGYNCPQKSSSPGFPVLVKRIFWQPSSSGLPVAREHIMVRIGSVPNVVEKGIGISYFIGKQN